MLHIRNRNWKISNVLAENETVYLDGKWKSIYNGYIVIKIQKDKVRREKNGTILT